MESPITRAAMTTAAPQPMGSGGDRAERAEDGHPNLDFFYGPNIALKSINLVIPARRVTSMIGPSGCGKSTLLRVLNRMYDLYPEQRATGEVLMDGKNLIAADVDLNALRAKVGMVFQKPTPFPMTVFENIAFGIRLHESMPRGALVERVEWSLQRAALWSEVKDRLETSALGLSGGQQQRLCIARTIAVRPEVILLDEPTSALDPLSTLKVEELIDELKREFTIVIVTHNMQQAARIADQTAFFYLGELIEVGPSEVIFTNPTQKKTTVTAITRVVKLRAAEVRTGMPTDHIVRLSTKAARKLADTVQRMGGVAEAQLDQAIDAVMRRDAELASRVIEGDRRIDAMEVQVDDMAIKMLALRQPVASDLRFVVGTLKISAEIERIGDYAKNVAKRAVALAQIAPLKPVHAIPRMGEVAQEMIKDVLDAYANRDVERADAVWARDAELDEMYSSLFRELLTYMMEDARNITGSTHLLFIAKNIERIGDHATNIAEQVHFMVTGSA